MLEPGSLEWRELDLLARELETGSEEFDRLAAELESDFLRADLADLARLSSDALRGP